MEKIYIARISAIMPVISFADSDLENLQQGFNSTMQSIIDEEHHRQMMQMWTTIGVVAILAGLAIWITNKHFKNEEEKRKASKINSRVEPKL